MYRSSNCEEPIHRSWKSTFEIQFSSYTFWNEDQYIYVETRQDFCFLYFYVISRYYYYFFLSFLSLVYFSFSYFFIFLTILTPKIKIFFYLLFLWLSNFYFSANFFFTNFIFSFHSSIFVSILHIFLGWGFVLLKFFCFFFIFLHDKLISRSVFTSRDF